MNRTIFSVRFKETEKEGEVTKIHTELFCCENRTSVVSTEFSVLIAEISVVVTKKLQELHEQNYFFSVRFTERETKSEVTKVPVE